MLSHRFSDSFARRGTDEDRVFVRPSPGMMWLFAALILASTLTPNPLLTAASVAVLPLFITLLWRENEPPILLFAISFQWLQVTAKLIYANIQGLPLQEVAWSSSIEDATWLSLIGLVVLAFGMHLGLRRLGSSRPAEWTDQISLDRLFVLYLGFVVFGEVVDRYWWILLQLKQPLSAVAEMKWVLFFILGYACLQRRSKYHLFIAAFLIEFILGIGFFSGFKTVFFFLALVLFTSRAQASARTLITATLVGTLLFGLGTIWHSIRGEYRSYLNQGTQTQKVLVSWSDRMSEMGALVSEVSLEDMRNATEPTFLRLAYTDYFAAAMEYVPESRSHTGGKLWGQSVQHVVMPRLFFPEKPVLPSDTELTARYTGLNLAGRERGTSISLGYMAESYVDFGRYGMYVPIFLVGLAWGFMYYFMMSRSTINLVGHGFATATLFHAHRFEVASIKLVGGVLTIFIFLSLFQTFAMPYLIQWLTEDKIPHTSPSTQSLSHYTNR